MPSLQRSIWFGGISFCLASLAVFATVAYAERWMYNTLGIYGAYLAWTGLFIALGGGVLYPLAKETLRLPKFYALFGASFFLYAAGWVAAYFILRDGLGEWVASLAGSLLMAFVFTAGFGIWRSTLKITAILFVANSAGYFLGSFLNDTVKGRTGMLLWGTIYGLFLGAGLGAVLHLAQRPLLSAVHRS